MQPITDPMQVFRHQRAVRGWADRPVDEDLVRQVLTAATHAPSGSNTQPWRFIVVRDADVKRRISDEYELAQVEAGGGSSGAAPAARQTIADAPVLIVPCVRVPGRTGRAGFQTGASIYPACQNLMLAARILGLGSVLTTRHRVRREQVHAILGIPQDWESAAIIPLGWPDGPYGPNRRPPVEEFLSYDRF